MVYFRYTVLSIFQHHNYDDNLDNHNDVMIINNARLTGCFAIDFPGENRRTSLATNVLYFHKNFHKNFQKKKYFIPLRTFEILKGGLFIFILFYPVTRGDNARARLHPRKQLRKHHRALRQRGYMISRDGMVAF